MELKEIRRKIGSVNNIWKLTSALEALSALKMKKAQKIALASRPFAQKAAQLLKVLQPMLEEKKSIFLQPLAGEQAPYGAGRKVEKVLFVAVASDRGFCGSFNQNILKLAEREISRFSSDGSVGVQVLPVGKKAASFFKKRGFAVNFEFFGIGDFAQLQETKSISDFLTRAFLESRFQKICLVYTDFISTFFQKPKMLQLLPLSISDLKYFLEPDSEVLGADFLVEPSKDLLAQEIVPQLIEYLIYQCILDSNAAEHSSRMLAMKNASDNAKGKAAELFFVYNKARQEQITREVCEISSAKEVLE